MPADDYRGLFYGIVAPVSGGGGGSSVSVMPRAARSSGVASSAQLAGYFVPLISNWVCVMFWPLRMYCIVLVLSWVINKSPGCSPPAVCKGMGFGRNWQ